MSRSLESVPKLSPQAGSNRPGVRGTPGPEHDAQGDIAEEAVFAHARPGLRSTLEDQLASAQVGARPVGHDQKTQTAVGSSPVFLRGAERWPERETRQGEVYVGGGSEDAQSGSDGERDGGQLPKVVRPKTAGAAAEPDRHDVG